MPNNNNNLFNYGIIATILPIVVCIILYAIWIILHKKTKIVVPEMIT